jgi:glutathione S-transferase
MLGLSGLWEAGRLPRLTDWWRRATARPSFKPQIIDWIPEGLTNDLRTYGPRSWPEIKRIVGIAA